MDNVVELLRWALVGIGLVYFFTESVFFSPIRVAITAGSPLRSALFYCAACTGFWVGCCLCAIWPWYEPHALVGDGVWLLHMGASGISLMGLGAFWATYRGGNNMWAIEASARGEATTNDSETEK